MQNQRLPSGKHHSLRRASLNVSEGARSIVGSVDLASGSTTEAAGRVLAIDRQNHFPGGFDLSHAEGETQEERPPEWLWPWQSPLDRVREAVQANYMEFGGGGAKTLKLIMEDAGPKADVVEDRKTDNLDKRESEMKERESEMKRRESEMKEREMDMQTRESNIKMREGTLAEKEKRTQKHEAAVRKREDNMRRREEQAMQKDGQLEILEAQLGSLKEQLNMLEAQKAEKEKPVETAAEKLSRIRLERRAAHLARFGVVIQSTPSSKQILSSSKAPADGSIGVSTTSRRQGSTSSTLPGVNGDAAMNLPSPPLTLRRDRVRKNMNTHPEELSNPGLRPQAAAQVKSRLLVPNTSHDTDLRSITDDKSMSDIKSITSIASMRSTMRVSFPT